MNDQSKYGSEPGHPLRGRFNSWLLAKYESAFHDEVGRRKEDLFAALKGLVVEIGAGNGINFRYYPAGIKVLAVEPNPYMHKRLLAAADRYNIDMELVDAGAEALELGDGVVDSVVCTLVLCTVKNPYVVINEVHRVLKPGGRFIFIEHVAAPDGSGLRRVQNLIQRPWHWLFEGCHTNRETAQLLEASGFHQVEYERFISAVMPPPIVPQICGVAIK